jgi:hypothetical protein
MGLPTAAGPVRVYRVLDGAGRAIGDVIQPRSRPVLAPGAGTVLLVRSEGEKSAPRLPSDGQLGAIRRPESSVGPRAAPIGGRSP